jgi:hypothetical protein
MAEGLFRRSPLVDRAHRDIAGTVFAGVTPASNLTEELRLSALARIQRLIKYL